jgi:hypothetical protein
LVDARRVPLTDFAFRLRIRGLLAISEVATVRSAGLPFCPEWVQHNDAWDATDPGLVCRNCLACKQWWHLGCLPEEEKETTELADPNGRCAKCIAGRRYHGALNRILELARLETGQYRLLLEYIGYNFYELDKQSALDVMERVGREALVEAYQRHEITRETRSLLFCVLALLDALDLGESPKTYGLHFKMTHDDPRLYLISHASLEKRGLSIGQASIYQMLAPEHRLYLPFSLPQLLVDVNGKALPKPPSISARPPGDPAGTCRSSSGKKNHFNGKWTRRGERGDMGAKSGARPGNQLG